jgi:hypothetical protein
MLNQFPHVIRCGSRIRLRAPGFAVIAARRATRVDPMAALRAE